MSPFSSVSRRTFPLSWHLVVLVFGAMVPLGVFSFFVVQELVASRHSISERNLLQSTRELAQTLDQEVATTVRTLQVLAASDRLASGDLKPYYEDLRRAVATQPSWISLILFSADGRPLLKSDRIFGEPLPVPHEPESLTRILHSREPTVGSLAVNPTNGKAGFPVRIPVFVNGEFRYVLTAAISANAIQRIVERSPVDAEWTRTIVDSKGNITARSRSPEKYVGKRATSPFLQRIERTAESVTRTRSLDAMSVYTGHSRAPMSGWTASISVPTAAFGGSEPSTTVMVASVALILLLSFGAAAWFLARRIAAPIRSVAEGAGRFLEGIPPEILKSSVREVEQLKDAMAQASALLAAHERERNEHLERAEQARREAEEASNAKDRFLAMLGHELRNPLGVINNAVYILLAEKSDDPKLANIQKIVQRQLAHLNHLLDDLLDASRITRGKIDLKLGQLDLNHIASDIVNDYRRLFEQRNVRLFASLGDQPLWVQGDRARLTQALGNLLSNALKFTPPEGRTTVRVHRADGQAKLTVEDSGTGIDPKTQATLFQPFVQGPQPLDRSQGGLGLGLSVVKGLVELHGGTVSLHSRGKDQGTRVEIQLPIAESEEHTSRSGPKPPPFKGRRVLVVEDFEDAAESLRFVLDHQGHEVEVSHTGRDALDRAERFRPDVVICDIGLPDMSGHEVCHHLRTSPATRGALIIALTGYGQREDVARSLEAGFDEHLTKPVDHDILEALLRRPADRSGTTHRFL